MGLVPEVEIQLVKLYFMLIGRPQGLDQSEKSFGTRLFHLVVRKNLRFPRMVTLQHELSFAFHFPRLFRLFIMSILAIVFYVFLAVLCLILLAFLALTIYLLIIRRKYNHLPGPKVDNFYLGNVPHIRRERRNGKTFYEIVKDWSHVHGPVFVVWASIFPL